MSVPAGAALEPAVTQVLSGRRRILRRLLHDAPSVFAMGILVLLIIAATVGAPLAASLTGHPPTVQYPDALSIDGLPIGIMDRQIGRAHV